MKKLLLTFLLTVVSVSMKAVLVDGIYYQVIDMENRKAMVVKGEIWNEDYTNYDYVYYKDTLHIPPTVVIEGTTFTVTHISCLSDCTQLTCVTLPNTIESIEQIAFQDCRKLASINLPSSLKEIGMNAFFRTGLKEISIPSSVRSIGAWAFYCDSLEKVFIPDLKAWCSMELGGDMTGVFYSKKPLQFYVGEELLTDLVIPETVTTIKRNTFSNFNSLTSVTFHEKVDSIANDAFRDCTGLQRVSISDLKAWCHIRFGITHVEQSGAVLYVTNPLYYAGHLFQNGVELTELDIPEGTENIGIFAFINCKELTKVNFPTTMRKVGAYAFEGCKNIKTVTTPSLRSYCDIDFGSLDSNPLAANKEPWWGKLSQLVEGDDTDAPLIIPDGVKEIKPYAFAANTSLMHLDIPASVKKIGTYAFYNNLSLGKLNIMGHLEEIGQNAFGNCTWLANGVDDHSIHVYDSNPVPISEKAFYNTYGSIPGRPYASDYIYGSPLHVPVGAKAKYEQTAGWKQFKTIIEDIEVVTLKGDVNGDGVVDVADIASVITVMASAPQPGEASSADVNGDGTVDVADIATVITIMASSH